MFRILETLIIIDQIGNRSQDKGILLDDYTKLLIVTFLIKLYSSELLLFLLLFLLLGILCVCWSFLFFLLALVLALFFSFFSHLEILIHIT